MKISLPSFETVERRSLARIGSSPLAGASQTSVVRQLLRTVIEEITGLGGLWETLGKVAAGAHPGTAEGEALDGVGTFYGERGRRRPGETDAEYRYRMSQIADSLEPGSLSSIEFAARSLAGVQEVQVRPFIFGPGSFALAFVGTADSIEIERTLGRWVAPGTYFKIYQAARVPVRIRAFVRLSSQASPADRASARSSVETALRRLIQSLPMGARLSLDQVRRTAIEAHTAVVACRIDRIEVYGAPAPIEDVLPPWDGVLSLVAADAVEVREDA